MRSLLLLSALGVAAGEGTTILTAKNFDKKVYGKKSAFVKFLAPW